jgi:hypothetical protein
MIDHCEIMKANTSILIGLLISKEGRHHLWMDCNETTVGPTRQQDTDFLDQIADEIDKRIPRRRQ